MKKRLSMALVAISLVSNFCVTPANALNKCNRGQIARIMILDSYILSAKANLNSAVLEYKAAELAVSAAQLRLDQINFEIARVKEISFLQDSDMRVLSSKSNTLAFLAEDKSEAENFFAIAKTRVSEAKSSKVLATNRVQKRIAAIKAISPNCIR